ncbi:MAG TPA: hypothetical protein VJT82_08810 [Pyrinomonadaceae bacterium]|nr:hypothetical protein [Pyrinomonadaceae bacterium]
MSTTSSGKWWRVAVALGIIAGVLALSAAVVRYVRYGQIDYVDIGMAIFFPALLYAIARQNNSRKQ